MRAAAQRAAGGAASLVAAVLSSALVGGCSGLSTGQPLAQGADVGLPKPGARQHREAPTPRPRSRAGASERGLPVSNTSSRVVQPQPRPGSCHARRKGLFSLPDPRCTPGAISRAVTQGNIHSTICRSLYTRTVRPSASVTEPEKRASLAAYGDAGPLHDYEYDHLVPLELGGAPNDPRNLWAEPGRTPNPKDELENRLREMVCSGSLSLPTAQREIASNWVALYHRLIG